MKTVEEKAKAYDEAIERARYWEKNPTVWSSDDICQKLFPELKESESEDERIRKELIEFVKSRLAGFPQCDRYIAWLEKQKAIDVLDEEERKFADDVDSYRKDMDEFYKKGYNAGREAEKQDWLEKQGKQKPQRQIAAEAKEAMYSSPTDKDIKEQIFTEYEKVKADTIAEKQAVWGEADEELRDSLVHFLQLYGDLQFSKPVKQSMIDWLKSIRSYNKWKPTKAQMEALLGEVIAWSKGCPKQIVFESLYNDLKKLMEE